MEVSGRLEMDDEVLHVIVNRMEDATWRLAQLSEDLIAPQLSRADEVNRPLRTTSAAKREVELIPEAANADCAPRQRKRTLAAPHPTHPRNVRMLPKSRDFH